MSKYQSIIITLTVIVFLAFFAYSPVLALEVKDYPNIPLPGVPKITTNSDIAEVAGYYFGVGIYLAALISLISFTVGSITFLSSMDSQEMKSEGKARMRSAGLGLLLVMASFLILQTINFGLVTQSFADLSPLEGVYLAKSQELKNAPPVVPDVSKLESGYNKILYKCNNGPALLIWKFKNKNLEKGNDLKTEVTVVRKSCNEEESIDNIGSYKLSFESIGVYYCLGGCGSGGMCSGHMSEVKQNSQEAIEAPFAGQISGVRFVGNADNQFGIILYGNKGLNNIGFCNANLESTSYSDCKPVPSPNLTLSADIYKKEIVNKAGELVEFFSEPFGWTPAARSGFAKFDPKDNNYQGKTLAVKVAQKDDKIVGGTIYKGTGFTYTNIDRSDNYKNLCKAFKECPGSIKITGRYLITLITDNSYCQTFRQDVPNLNVQPIVATDPSHPIEKINITGIK